MKPSVKRKYISNWIKEYEETMRDYGMTVHRQDFTWGTSSIIVGTKTA